MTTKEAGKRLGVSDSRVRQFVLEKRLEATRHGHLLAIHEDEVERLAKQLAEEAPRRRGPNPNVTKLQP
jgi:excisionase family DNA binding protein